MSITPQNHPQQNTLIFHLTNKQQTTKQPNNQTTKQTNKQTNKQTTKQPTNQPTNQQNRFVGREWRMITHIRQPDHHVLSQYKHCTGSPKHLNRFPEMPDFDTWVDYWLAHPFTVSPSDNPPFDCYNPNNLQSQYFSSPKQRVCWTRNGKNEKQLEQHICVMSILINLQKLYHLGITEFYKESFCLLLMKMHSEVPPFCTCDGHNRSASFFTPHFDRHGVPEYSPVLSPSQSTKVNKLVGVDWELYCAGVDLFVQDLEKMVDRFGDVHDLLFVASNTFGSSQIFVRARPSKVVLFLILPIFHNFFNHPNFNSWIPT